MYFTMLQHAGLVTFILYFIVIWQKIKFFKVLVLIGLLHYGDITTPLTLYMLLTYSYIISNKLGIK